jgi:transcriptional regulator with XRE-family HTH domain/DNA polymerase III delta prime subunit
MSSLPSGPFGDLLRRYRLAAGLTQEELAERAHLSVQAIGALERGDRRAPRRDTLALLADALQLAPEERARLETTGRRRLTLVTALAQVPLPLPPAPAPRAPVGDDQPRQDSADVPVLHVPASNPNRQRLLKRVRSFWIDGVLEESLHGAALIALDVREQSDALANPWRLVFEQPSEPARLLPRGTRITQVYDQAGGELLILGEPGSGKTTLLLELARDLLHRAARDDTHPMPVILNLSSWAIKRQPIEDWLVAELNDKYQVPHRIGRNWLAADQLLPLLDGLDEVAPAYQSACVEAINSFRRDHGLAPLVICSRKTDYLTQTARLLLDGAVVVQPLSDEQIDEYVASGGESLAAIRTALGADPVLRELTATPLMLSVLALAYAGKRIEELPAPGSLADHRRQIFAMYTERMLQRRGARGRYPREQTISWLRWLAKQLVQRQQSAFAFEQLQVDWLPHQRWSWLIVASSIGAIIGVFCFLIYELAVLTPVAPLRKLVVGLLFGGVTAILYVIVNGLLESLEREENEEGGAGISAHDTWSWARVRRTVATILGARLVYGFLFAALGVLILFRFASDSVLNEEIVLNGIAFWVGFAVIGRLELKIQPVEVVSWSWQRVRRQLPNILFIGLAGGVLLGILLDVAALVWRHDLQESLLSFFLPILALGLGISVCVAVVRGVSHDVLDTTQRVLPNQGIRNSLRNGVVFGLVYGLLVGILSGLILTGVRFVTIAHLTPGLLLRAGLSDGIGFGLAAAGVVWAGSGGLAAVQHGVLRLRLWRAGCMPWQYAPFLDYAADCLLLRKAGGEYLFLHRLLLDFFAETPHTFN